MKTKKEIRREIRRTARAIFSRRTMTKVLVIFTSVAILATYVLPYILG